MYSLKILDISLTFSELKEDKSISFKDWHLKNIFDIYFTFLVFNEDKLIFSNDSQERNILDIFLTYCELNGGKKFISVKDVILGTYLTYSIFYFQEMKVYIFCLKNYIKEHIAKVVWLVINNSYFHRFLYPY